MLFTVFVSNFSIFILGCLLLFDFIKMPGRTHFNPAWKLESEFNEWLDVDEESQFIFYCKKCQCISELGNKGKGAVSKHLKAKKHSAVHEVQRRKSA